MLYTHSAYLLTPLFSVSVIAYETCVSKAVLHMRIDSYVSRTVLHMCIEN